MDDFDLSGPGSWVPPAAPPLTDISIVYALLMYFAFAFLIVGLLFQTWRLLRQLRLTPPALEGQTTIGRLFRAGTDIVLLRSTFFADRWAWIFGACFHFGLALILLRHLRYFIDPNRVGPLWHLEEFVQPFGFYSGALLPLGAALWWARQVVLNEGKIARHWTDHAVMLLLITIPVVGYINNHVHTDVIALKAYALGLVTAQWANIPPDPWLLAHLWLVAALMIVIPFSRLLLLLPLGNLLRIATAANEPKDLLRSRFLRRFGPVLAVILLAPVAVVIHHAAKEGLHSTVPALAGLVREHRNADGSVMIRSHPKFLFSHRAAVLHSGTVVPDNNLERCVTCHAAKDDEGQAVGFDNPKHFCRGCHTKAAVTIDCFECHTSKPAPGRQATP